MRIRQFFYPTDWIKNPINTWNGYSSAGFRFPISFDVYLLLQKWKKINRHIVSVYLSLYIADYAYIALNRKRCAMTQMKLIRTAKWDVSKTKYLFSLSFQCLFLLCFRLTNAWFLIHRFILNFWFRYICFYR